MARQPSASANDPWNLPISHRVAVVGLPLQVPACTIELVACGMQDVQAKAKTRRTSPIMHAMPAPFLPYTLICLCLHGRSKADVLVLYMIVVSTLYSVRRCFPSSTVSYSTITINFNVHEHLAVRTHCGRGQERARPLAALQRGRFGGERES